MDGGGRACLSFYVLYICLTTGNLSTARQSLPSSPCLDPAAPAPQIVTSVWAGVESLLSTVGRVGYKLTAAGGVEAAISAGSWHHVVLSINEAFAALAVDGVEVGSQAANLTNLLPGASSRSVRSLAAPRRHTLAAPELVLHGHPSLPSPGNPPALPPRRHRA